MIQTVARPTHRFTLFNSCFLVFYLQCHATEPLPILSCSVYFILIPSTVSITQSNTYLVQGCCYSVTTSLRVPLFTSFLFLSIGMYLNVLQATPASRYLSEFVCRFIEVMEEPAHILEVLRKVCFMAYITVLFVCAFGCQKCSEIPQI